MKVAIKENGFNNQQNFSSLNLSANSKGFTHSPAEGIIYPIPTHH
jgi:hypothetical protein